MGGSWGGTWRGVDVDVVYRNITKASDTATTRQPHAQINGLQAGEVADLVLEIWTNKLEKRP